MNLPRYIIIHESDSPFGAAGLIDQWHKERGFQRGAQRKGALRHIGYHYVILNGRLYGSRFYDEKHDGLIEKGRDEDEVAAAAVGLNGESINVCLIGRDGVYTARQTVAAMLLSQMLMYRYGLTEASVIGHYETPHEQQQPAAKRKACPSIDMVEFRSQLARMYSAFCGELKSEA